jgi:hypothetical protein
MTSVVAYVSRKCQYLKQIYRVMYPDWWNRKVKTDVRNNAVRDTREGPEFWLNISGKRRKITSNELCMRKQPK